MQRFTGPITNKIKEKRVTHITHNYRGSSVLYSHNFLGAHSGVRGGGKCPEEEHST
jgi:hypothetical protein